MAKTYPLPKRGKKRMINQGGRTRKNPTKGPAYRQNICTRADRKISQLRMSVTIKDLLKTTDKDIIKKLDSYGWLQDKTGSSCEYCHVGKLGALKHYESQGWKHRCPRMSCHRYVSRLAGHPILITQRGSYQVPLQDQAAAVLCQL
jgi:hypothetical protein